MRALLGGLIGAGVSAAAWLGVEHTQQSSFGWMVVLVGIVTGVCVNWASKGGAGGFGRGALAILLTLAAIVGGRQVYAKYMQSNAAGAATAAVTMSDIEAADDDVDSDTDGESSDDADAEIGDSNGEAAPRDASKISTPNLDRDAIAVGNRNYSKSSMKRNMTEWDMLWMCAAALAAYITGKGGGTKGTSEAIQEEPAAPPAEPSEPETNDAE